MYEQATKRGMLAEKGYVYEYKIDLKEKIHDSAYKIFGIEIGKKDRKATISPENTPVIHQSVIDKMRYTDYKPTALLDFITDIGALAPYIIEE